MGFDFTSLNTPFYDDASFREKKGLLFQITMPLGYVMLWFYLMHQVGACCWKTITKSKYSSMKIKETKV